MSKNYHNYPDPKELIEKYGGDALRLYLLGSPVMRGEDILISEEQYRQQVKGLLLILWNSYNFFISYANVDGWEKSDGSKSENLLDKWILSLLNNLILCVTTDLDKFDTVGTIDKINNFINEFSTWYIRRSRDRVGPSAEDEKDKNYFYSTCHEVLVTLCKLLAPIAPFTVEEMHKNLTGKDSVHLEDWPQADKSLVNEDLMRQMEMAREIVEKAHSLRKESSIKVRQPLANLTSAHAEDLPKEILDIIAQEVNVKNVSHKKGEFLVSLDTKITKELEEEAMSRDLVRKIQEERKALGTSLDEKVDVALPDWPKEFESEIKRKALISSLSKGEFKVSKI